MTVSPWNGIETILFDSQDLARIVARLAGEIERDYAHRVEEGIVLIGVMKGVVHFLSDLSRALTLPHVYDIIIARSYYDSTKSNGVLELVKGPDMDLSGRHVILVDDIYDTGLTLHRILEHLRRMPTRSVEACVLFHKPEASRLPLAARYVGAQAPNRFLVGYGLDHAERYRHLPFVGVLDENGG